MDQYDEVRCVCTYPMQPRHLLLQLTSVILLVIDVFQIDCPLTE